MRKRKPVVSEGGDEVRDVARGHPALVLWFRKSDAFDWRPVFEAPTSQEYGNDRRGGEIGRVALFAEKRETMNTIGTAEVTHERGVNLPGPDPLKLPTDKPKRSKYGNRKTTVDGIEFDSKREAELWPKLKAWAEIGGIWDLRRQVEYRLEVNGVLICKYRSDFEFSTNDLRVGPTGSMVRVPVLHVWDAKGVKTREFRLKAKLMKAIHGIEVECV
jgi:Protein of unknown function (DUF1064)